MSLTRYSPQILDSFRLLAARPVAAARIVVPGLAAVVGGQALASMGGNLAPVGMALSALAVTGMGFLWQRQLAQGEALSPLQMVLRFVLWSIILQLLQGFELAPTILFGILLKDVPNAEVYTRTGIQLFQVLIGGLFLILPHLALGSWKELAGTKLQEMVLSGGIAVGLGYVIINLPFIMVGEIAKALFIEFAPGAGEAVQAMTMQAVHALNILVVAGYFALVWALVKDLPSRFAIEPEAVPAEPKQRRTTRVNRTTKAKR
ncbi:MAG TPA: hypothetical protein VK196_07900 [Magnetospirillum sp.]|nr:hypothetical protein [Magnetospirillum sp.]